MQHPVTKNHKLLPRAKELRKEMTPQERHLWYDFLRDYPVKIYKQRIIDSFIADFYCASARLVIELDGSQHFTKEGLLYERLVPKSSSGMAFRCCGSRIMKSMRNSKRSAA